MQLVQHQELKTGTVVHHLPVDVLIAGEDQLQHHEVGQQNVRRIGGDSLTDSCILLPSVALDGQLALVGAKMIEKLAHLFQLTVGEGIHRVDDDRPSARGRIQCLLPEYPIENRQEKGERLAGAGARGHDVAAARFGLGERLLLVLEKPNRLRSATRARNTEDLPASRMENTLGNQLVDILRPLVVRIDLH